MIGERGSEKDKTMVIEPFSPYIECLAIAEPWRLLPEPNSELCEGAIDWDGSAYWCCQSCGRIGTSTVQIHHPARNFAKVLVDFVLRR